MIITPASEIAGHTVVKTLGLVRGNTIREIEEYTKMMDESREQAVDRMVAEARQLGANAITDVGFATSYMMGAASEILVFGNAVIVEPE
jgi:uncharacterized protein YbjQ (UPF0145 family)